MNVYTTDKIRNVVLLGHGGAGKTSLVEAMAYLAGMTSRMGKVEDGNTIRDYDKEETKRLFSINTSVIPIEETKVPDYSKENLDICREVPMEAVAETSEEFMDRYFGGEEFSEDEIPQTLRVNVADGSIAPVLMGFNLMARGIYTLLVDIVKYLPSPEKRSCTGMNAKIFAHQGKFRCA